MADRVSASIRIGGFLTADQFAELAAIIAQEDLMIDWDGEAFEHSLRIVGEPLALYAYEVSWGRFEILEAWCLATGLSFARWSGACQGQWGAERVVFSGSEGPTSYPVDEEDELLIGRNMAVKLGSFEAIIAYFNAGDQPMSPLIVEGDP